MIAATLEWTEQEMMTALGRRSVRLAACEAGLARGLMAISID